MNNFTILRRNSIYGVKYLLKHQMIPPVSRLSTSTVQYYGALSLQTINPNLRKMEYAVRGPIVIRAQELENKLKSGESMPFSEVIRCNIGDCHAMQQPPLTYLRQLVAVCTLPSLMNNSDIPSDVKEKAQRILNDCGGGSIGAYSNSTGVEVIRKDVAKYIESRDNIQCDHNNVYLSTGASEAIKSILQLISTQQQDNGRAGVMVPIPQYPLYSATNSEYNAYQINYYLDEDNAWGLSENELERALSEAKGQCQPRAIVVINPGNPTGQVLQRQDIENVLKFAHKNNLMVLADEVYQHNIYADDREFHSFKKVLHDLGGDASKSVQLVSFMSTSKGYMGECGFRGGYGELVNFPLDVRAEFYKALSAKLCCSVSGQVMLDAVVNPPQPGDPSYDLFIKEKSKVLGDLKTKAKMTTETFNSMPGFKCNVVQGAMYSFPQLELPQKAVEAAKSKNMAPDFMYCIQLLEETGVCVVPGSGFGQRPGTHHFRITILPPVDKMKIVMGKIKQFHEKFLNQYG